MKTSSAPIRVGLFVAAVILFQSAYAGSHDRYAQYNYQRRNRAQPSQSTNQASKTEPQEKPQKFKDLPLNTEFYFLADKDRKLFPRIKISETSAKSVPTASSATVTTNPVPVETMVFVKKDSPDKKDDKKDKKKQ